MCIRDRFVVDVSEALGPADKHVMARIAESRQPKFLALNKADRLDPRFVVEHVRQYQELFGSEAATMLTSGTRGDNLDKLLEMMVAVLPRARSITRPISTPIRPNTSWPPSIFVSRP